jgi:hypothetical protein
LSPLRQALVERATGMPVNKRKRNGDCRTSASEAAALASRAV